MIKAVTPAEAVKPITPADIFGRGGPVDRVNETLRRPWSESDRVEGRLVGFHKIGDRAAVEAVVDHFSEAGWWIEARGSIANGDWLVFRPPVSP